MANSSVVEHPILFSAPMVRAILREADPKTQTRRVITPQPPVEATFAGQMRCSDPKHDCSFWWCSGDEKDIDTWGTVPGTEPFFCRHGLPGDRLWVKETYGIFSVDTGSASVGYKERLPEGKTIQDTDGGLDVIHVDDCERWKWAESRVGSERWRPSIFMPHWLSRITLEITDVRVQRVQDISEEDAIAEGFGPRQARALFRGTWDSINAKRGHGWDVNDWVWAISFNRVEVGQ